MYVSSTIFEIFDVEEYRDLEILVRCHSHSHTISTYLNLQTLDCLFAADNTSLSSFLHSLLNSELRRKPHSIR